uniref:Putative lipocalin-3 1 n=1 Tax=Amblyomma parvum TaxID=251391 RepID=A0A023FZ04_AMBPA
MLSTLIFSTVVLALFIAPAEQHGSITTRRLFFPQYDISEFVGTPLPIWTYNSTSSPEIMCQVDVMVNMSRYHIIFNRSRHEDKGMSKKMTDLMEGKFMETTNDTMLVGPLSMLVTQTEKILYDSPDYQCAVIEVTITGPAHGHSWYDLRVRNSSVTQGPSWDCREKFNIYARNGTVRYTNDCQKILPLKGRRRRSKGWY